MCPPVLISYSTCESEERGRNFTGWNSHFLTDSLQVLFLLDVSSSMAASLREMVEALAQLLLQWGTCPVHRVKR